MAEAEVATLAGGCFWCLDAVYVEMRGVQNVESGYMGGVLEEPTYQQVSNGNTGHAEVARITYDPAVISYDALLDVFFTIHDPTQLNRQGNDVGTQYRSAIFYQTAEQEAAARAAITRAAAIWDGDVVTEVKPATTFWPAEDYHQGYFADNPYQPYCMAVVAPKVKKAREKFRQQLKPGVGCV